MILSSVTATLGKEGTVMLVLLLWAILMIVFLVLRKRIHSFYPLFTAHTNTSSHPRTFEARLLENKPYLYFFFIFLSLSLLMGIINLYLQTPFISLLTILFIVCSLMIFSVYLTILFLFIWKTWWGHWQWKKKKRKSSYQFF